MKKEVTKEDEYEKSLRHIKFLRKLLIGFDVLAIIILVLQIIAKNVSYSSFIVLILCNILTFTIKPKKDN